VKYLLVADLLHAMLNTSHAVPCGAMLCLCRALQVKFVPGRPDSRAADQDDQLPNFNDNYFHTVCKGQASGFRA
jgi:hypothetical protein